MAPPLKADHHAFLGWRQESGREREALPDVTAHLVDFLIQQIEEVQTEWPDAPRPEINCAEKNARTATLPSSASAVRTRLFAVLHT